MKNHSLKLKNPYFLFFTFSFLVLPLTAQGAVLYLTPESQAIYQGDTFVIEVRIDTEGEEINAVESYLMFLPDSLGAVDLSEGNSVLTFFVEEPGIEEGVISFAGGVPNGFEGEGLLAKISFLGKEIGGTDIGFKENSKVLLNDGEGTPAQLSLRGGGYEIIEKPRGLPVITSESHTDQNKWYKTTDLYLRWNLVEGAEYSYLLSYDPLAEPDKTPDKPEGELVWMGDMKYDLKKEGDGIYYFSLGQKLLGEDWSGVARFRVMIDSASPEEFEPRIGQDPAVFAGKHFLSFAAQDKASGVGYYEVAEISRVPWKRQKEEWKRGESPYLLEDQSLRSIIKVKAVDKAGNERIAEIMPAYKVIWKDIVFPLLILVGIGVVWWVVRRILWAKKHSISK